MSYPMPLQQKMRTLALQDATLSAALTGGNGTFRWFDTQLPKGYVAQGTCVTVQQISDVLDYVQNGPIQLDWVRVQLNIFDMNSVTAKNIASYLVANWFPAVDFVTDSMFLSPPGPPLQSPNFKLSQRGVIDYDVQPVEVWREILEYRIGNNISI